MATILLTKGLIALVDDEDLESLSEYPWYAQAAGTTTYAARRGRAGESRVVYMHSQITGLKRVDHKNHNGLDNRHENLRGCTASQNSANARSGRLSMSGYRGVYYNPKNRPTNPYQAMIAVNGKAKHVGNYPDAITAAKARDAAALRQWGEFAILNFTETAQ